MDHVEGKFKKTKIENSYAELQSDILAFERDSASESELDDYFDTYADYFEDLEESYEITGTNLAKLIEDFCEIN